MTEVYAILIHDHLFMFEALMQMS